MEIFFMIIEYAYSAMITVCMFILHVWTHSYSNFQIFYRASA